MSNASGSQKDNPFNMEDEQIMNLVHEYFGQPDESFDDDSLFIIVKTILQHSTQIVDEVIPLSGRKASPEKKEAEKSPNPNFTVPLSTLKKIGCELSYCKASDSAAETAHEATLAILKELRNYTWQAKAVLTLASFAVEFGDFLHLVELDYSKKQDQFTKSLGLLKGADSLNYNIQDPLGQRQRKVDAVVELNKMINVTMDVMEIIFKLEKLASYDPKTMSELPIPLYVYWIIITVVACGTKVGVLTSNESTPHNVSSYKKKVDEILSKLQKSLEYFIQLEEDENRYSNLVRDSNNHLRVMEFLKGLLLAKITDSKIIDGYDVNYYKKVEINVLEKKKLFIVISQPDITDDEINLVKPILRKIKKDKLESLYGIVWMPIAETKTRQFEKPLELWNWMKSRGIIWYSTAQLVSEAPVIRFVKQEWHFKSDPIVVVLNMEKGRVENLNAFYTIRLWGLEAFPFDDEAENNMFEKMNLVQALFKDFTDPPKWGKNKKEEDYYVFLYGGTNNNKITEMETKLNTLQANINTDTKLELKITIKLFNVEEKDENKKRFWRGVEDLFLTKLHKPRDTPKSQIQKLFSYKNKEGWFIFNKRQTTVSLGHYTSLLKVVTEFSAWKDNAQHKTFEVAFKEYHEKTLTSHLGQIGCCRIEIPPNTAKLPEEMKCEECERDMRIITSYECCHQNNNGHIQII